MGPPKSLDTPSWPELRHRLFPPCTWNTCLQHYMPMTGAVSHTLFAMHLMKPSVMTRWFPTADWAVSNALFFNGALGTGLYMYYRRHMRKVAPMTRVMYSVFTAAMFNFGSVMFWATAKVVFLPANCWVRGIFATFTSVCFLAMGRDYVRYIDSMVTEDNRLVE